MKKVIGILAGSLRKESFSKKVSRALVGFAPEGFKFRIIDLSNIPVYNQDFDDENQVPEAIARFRSEMAAVEGVIFVTPEYNRSVPGVLKNAIDVGSRPYGKSVWDKKPAAIFSNSPGNLSAFGANHHLRQSLVFLNMPTMQQPEVYISHVSDLFDDEGNMKDGTTKDFIKKAVESYIDWYSKNAL